MIKRTYNNGWKFKFYPICEKEFYNFFLNLYLLKGGLKNDGI